MTNANDSTQLNKIANSLTQMQVKEKKKGFTILPLLRIK
jgi:hypothetical protein